MPDVYIMKYHHIYPNFFSLTPLILPQLCLSLNLCYFVFFDKPFSVTQCELVWNQSLNQGESNSTHINKRE